jgi:hypothetical protein
LRAPKEKSRSGKDLARIAQSLLVFFQRMFAMSDRRMYFQTVPLAVVKKIAMLESESTMESRSGTEREFAKETVNKTEPYGAYPAANEEQSIRRSGKSKTA